MSAKSQIQFKTKNELLPEVLDISDLQLTDEGVNSALRDHPARYAWIAVLHGQLKALRKGAEAALKTVTAEAYMRAKSGEGKITEEMAKAIALSDEAVIAATVEVNDLTYDEEQMMAVREAYRDRKECAIELGRDLRQVYGQSGSPSA